MTRGWDALDAELAHWATEGLRLPLWWRDDDAIAPTEALARLYASWEDESGFDTALNDARKAPNFAATGGKIK